MKNIKIYNASKYSEDLYEKAEPDIYKTYVMPAQSDSYLSLSGITDNDKIKMLNELSGWKKGEEKFEEDFYILIHEGKKYYKEIDDEEWIYENPNQNKAPELSYVTSMMFEQEPQYGENEPSDALISQYPLEDILDRFNCYCSDMYEKENASDKVNSYIEFSSPDIEDIRNLFQIVGKHVYNKETDDYVELVIE